MLIGSVLGTLRNAEIAPIRKRSRSDSTQSVETVKPKSIPWLRNGLLGIVVSAGCGMAIFYLVDSLRSLSIADSMVDWTKAEDKKLLEEQTPDRVREMAKIWASDNALLKENSVAMRSFADSLLFDYRMNQMIASPPIGAWAQVWSNTSPVLLQLALQREPDRMKKDQIIESIGGQKAIDLLERSTNWYALGQTKSPLDWRLLWGRCLSTTVCDQNDIARLLPASMVIAKHNAQQLLSTTILFRDQFDESQFDRILAQAMKANPGAALNSAKLIAMERTDKDISINIFPQRSDILQSIAMQTFTKGEFPETNRQLWERARELIVQAPMTASRREIWLADSSIALADINGEIAHLKKAVMYEPNDVKLHCRLANRLIDIMDTNGAKKVLMTLQRIDPGSIEVKALAERISKI